MAFWDTVLGHTLAEVLIEALPKIAVKEQYTAWIGNSEALEYIDREINDGNRFIAMEKDTDGTCLVIMEKGK